jgi:hypothetical protein
VFPQVLPKEEQMKQQAAETSVQDEEAVIRLGRLDLGCMCSLLESCLQTPWKLRQTW